MILIIFKYFEKKLEISEGSLNGSWLYKCIIIDNVDFLAVKRIKFIKITSFLCYVSSSIFELFPHEFCYAHVT